MIVVAKISTMDLTGLSDTPPPFLDEQGNQIGKVIFMKWDGKHTIATIEIPDCNEGKIVYSRIGFRVGIYDEEKKP